MVDLRRHLERRSAFSEINITPFTDIVLVLLIVFMIAAPGLVQSGLDIDLPGSSSSQPGQPAEWILSLDRSGHLVLDGVRLEQRNLARELQSRLSRSAGTALVVNADREVPHGRVVEILDIVRNSGIKEIYVGTRRRDGL